ncbi:NAD(+)-dependent DNA ligase [Metamycoplasma cloacale]|uniref:DNA ligase n=1 Tax=Metamycoplasma cloacale TaxID=92401 RepID=A0A2Z4LLZ0_9BACT|nr:NAD-dependent DNA ligase LigA [Metamycoplasma cloacale]AWX42811.1 NAD-dependent DNA ligase LigA [Metamycoplasma cloacale]VEU79370.1 NAD(+)-dependent DNA ligase [Metamycoplasma cloacale]
MNSKEIKIKQEILDLQSKINEWDNAYYNLDNPIVEDAVYDNEILRLKKLEEQYAYLFTYEELKNSPTQKINAFASETFTKIRHNEPMLSLNKAYTYEEIEKFIAKIDKIAVNYSFYIEPKIDGLSISIKYKNGKLWQAVTRGDGLIGEDVTENVKQIECIPKEINYLNDLEVRGEIYLSISDFNNLNRMLELENKPKMANPRNGAAGTLRQLNPEIVKERKLSAFLYYIVNPELHNIKTMTESFEFLSKLEFPISKETKTVYTIEEIFEYINNFKTIKTSLDYETDGIVIKLNELKYYNELGYTVKFPHSAIAFKYEPDTVSTTLKNIFATIGRTGLVTYNAELEPVTLSGSRISFATLNNYQYIYDLNLNTNDLVYIKKAGEIIPCVISLVNKKEELNVFNKIITCPYCKESLIDSETFLEQYCINPNCPEIIRKRLIHFASKEAMELDTLGEKNIDFFIEKGFIKNIDDFFRLKERSAELTNLEGFGYKSIMNILISIEKSKELSLERIIFAFSIKHIGAKVSKFIASKVVSLDQFIDFDFEQLTSYDEIGPKIVSSLKEWCNNEHNRSLVTRILDLGVNLVYKSNAKSNILENLTFVITGELSQPRSFYEKMILENGGKITSSVSQKTNYLLCGEKAGSKLEKAQKLNIKIINENEFYDLCK